MFGICFKIFSKGVKEKDMGTDKQICGKSWSFLSLGNECMGAHYTIYIYTISTTLASLKIFFLKQRQVLKPKYRNSSKTASN